MATRKDFEFNDKAGLVYVIATLRSKIQGYLQEYVRKEDLTKVTIDVDTELSETSQNPLTNQATTLALSKKAPIASPEFTGTPKAPLAVAGSNDLQIANTAFVHQAIQSAVSNITSIKIEIVDALPETGDDMTIYFVPSAVQTENNVFDEYVYSYGKWELIGSTAVDLTGYLKEEQLVPISEEEIDAMFADW